MVYFSTKNRFAGLPIQIGQSFLINAWSKRMNKSTHIQTWTRNQSYLCFFACFLQPIWLQPHASSIKRNDQCRAREIGRFSGCCIYFLFLWEQCDLCVWTAGLYCSQMIMISANLFSASQFLKFSCPFSVSWITPATRETQLSTS